MPLEAAVASGPFQHLPVAWAQPRDSADLRTLLHHARAHGWTLIPRGGATAMPGGNVGPGVVVDLATSFARMESPEPSTGTIRVGAGVTGDRLDEAARKVGLRFPPLPSSAVWCTVGGMLACNAAGARSYRFGSVRDWVEGVEGVLTDGTPFRWNRGGAGGVDRRTADHPVMGLHLEPDAWPRVRKNASGYDLPGFQASGDPIHLLVGSEGTLAFITGATLRLDPLPSYSALALLELPGPAALPTVLELAREVGASACEFLGQRLLRLLDPIPGDPWGCILLEVEGRDPAAELKVLAGACGLPFRFTDSPEAMSQFWNLRKGISPFIRDAAASGLLSTQFIEDSVVPPERLGEYIAGVEALLASEGTDHILFGHAGDGNLHLNPLLDVKRPDWRDRAHRLLEGTARLVAHLGGTLTGEHGDGRIRAPWLELVYGARNVEAFRTVKEAFDPHGLLNPGVILPLSGQDPLEDLHSALLWESGRTRTFKGGGAPFPSTFGWHPGPDPRRTRPPTRSST